MKRKLEKGEVVFGTWIRLKSNYLIKIIADCGFDFVYIDTEHSSMSIETVAELCFAAQLVGLVPIVRPAGKLPHLLSRPLDCGAMGLLIPNVETKEEAQKIVINTKYKPLGNRGLNLGGVHNNFNINKVDGRIFTETMNRESILIVQIESKKGVDNIDDILSVEGIDGAVIGRGDLSQDLNIPGQTNHSEVLNAVTILIQTCKKHNVYPGFLVNDIRSAKEWIEKGIKIVSFGSDTSLLIKAYKEIAISLKGI